MNAEEENLLRLLLSKDEASIVLAIELSRSTGVFSDWIPQTDLKNKGELRKAYKAILTKLVSFADPVEFPPKVLDKTAILMVQKTDGRKHKSDFRLTTYNNPMP